MEQAELDFVGAGWLRALPAPALYAYCYVTRLAWGKGGPVPGDLDDLDPQELGADKYGGLDVPLGQSAITEDADDEPHWSESWDEWQRYAAERGCPLETYRHVVEFMAEIGLLERRIKDDVVWWRPVTPCPLPEDVLPLSDEERQMQSRLRWRDAFRYAENRIVGWLVDQRDEATELKVETSLTGLADLLDLDLDDTRHALTGVVGEADISATPDPESVGAEEPLLIIVDWQRFDEIRIAVQLVIPEEQ